MIFGTECLEFVGYHGRRTRGVPRLPAKELGERESVSCAKRGDVDARLLEANELLDLAFAEAFASARCGAGLESGVSRLHLHHRLSVFQARGLLFRAHQVEPIMPLVGEEGEAE